MNKNKLVCIIGRGGGGKDTLLDNIINNKSNYNKILMSTTRPMRYGEVYGAPYKFRTENMFHELNKMGKVFEYRGYDTIHGRWYYFTEVQDLDTDKNYVISITPDTLSKFKCKYSDDFEIVSIFLDTDIHVAFNRTIDRMKNNLNVLDIQEAFRRVLDDERKFHYNTEYDYNNYTKFINTDNCTIEEVYEQVKDIL